MKPQLLTVPRNVAHSFSIRQDTRPDVNTKWHYHEEVELIYFKKGTGTQFIGDNIKTFRSGDVVLVGSYLPHYWRFDEAYFAGQNDLEVDVRVLHFNKSFWGDTFLNLPESNPIKSILEKARRGINITGRTKDRVVELIDLIVQNDGIYRIIYLMEALTRIAACNRIIQLSSLGFDHFEETESGRISAIYEYAIANCRRNITLQEIAHVAGVSPNSFCRFFKLRAGKTFSRFLIEIRVGNACKLIIEKDISIKEVCYESGFNNFASFHKHFKEITGRSPLNYQKEFKQPLQRLLA